MPKKTPVTAKQIMEMIQRQRHRCAISGRELTPETASLDHIQPLSRGGTHETSNLCIVEHLVNSAKGTMTLKEFVSMCRDVTEHQSRIGTGNSD